MGVHANITRQADEHTVEAPTQLGPIDEAHQRQGCRETLAPNRSQLSRRPDD